MASGGSRKPSQNIQLILEFLKAPFLVLHFSYYTLMTYLMVLYVILLSVLMILLSTLSVFKPLICDNNYNNFNVGITQLNLTGLITLLLIWKWMGLFWRKNHMLRCWSRLHLLNWIGALALTLFLKLLQENRSLDWFYEVSFS